LIKRLSSGKASEHEQSYWLQVLKRNLPHPEISDLIYWRDLSPEEILAKALAYKPIQL
jgi:hypothetical protein